MHYCSSNLFYLDLTTDVHDVHQHKLNTWRSIQTVQYKLIYVYKGNSLTIRRVVAICLFVWMMSDRSNVTRTKTAVNIYHSGALNHKNFYVMLL